MPRISIIICQQLFIELKHDFLGTKQCYYFTLSLRAFHLKSSKNQDVSEIQNILTSGVKLSSCLTSHTTAQFRTAVANVGKHTQMLTPCHFRITSCLDIHAQKTEPFHAFENSLFPSNSNMRGSHYFFPHIKARCIYGFTDISQSPWSQGFAFLDFSTVVMHA